MTTLDQAEGVRRSGGAARRGLARAAAAAAVAGLLAFAPAGGEAKAPPDGFADLAERLLPAVVNISTTQAAPSREGPESELPRLPPGSPFEEFFKDFFERNRPDGAPNRAPRRARSLGSGFFVDASGVVVTNNHVIADAEEIRVRLHDDSEFDAEILGRDPKTDIAVLKIDPGDKELTTVAFGDSDKVRVGDWVVAIGNPFGLSGSVTAGIVSARGRDINQGAYDDFIQTDASINRGNSGGPLFDLDGNVIGVNTAIFSQTGGSVGIGFAVAARLAESVVAQLRKFGRTKRGWLGVRIQTVTEEIAEGLGLPEATGAMVAEVTEDGPAETAGIRQGDVILTFDGREVETMRRLPRIVAETEVGVDVPVELWRDGETLTVTARIGELEEAEARLFPASETEGPDEKTGRIAEVGLELARLTEELRNNHSVGDDVHGVAIVGVDPDGPAADKGLRVGDVIVEVDQTEVRTPVQVARIVREVVEKGRKKSVLFTVNRDGSIRYLGIRVREN